MFGCWGKFFDDGLFDGWVDFEVFELMFEIRFCGVRCVFKN